jgi:hypothetical protein
MTPCARNYRRMQWHKTCATSLLPTQHR